MRDEGKKNPLGDDGTEPGPLDSDIGLRPTADTLNLRTDMLAFPIAICPYHQHVCASCFRRKVRFNALAVLGNEAFDGYIEKRNGIARIPLSVGVREVMGCQVAGYASDSELCTSLGVIKVVVPYVFVLRRTLSEEKMLGIVERYAVAQHTDVNCPPDRI